MEKEIGKGDRNIQSSRGQRVQWNFTRLSGSGCGPETHCQFGLAYPSGKDGQFRAAQVDHDVAIEVKSSQILLQRNRKRVAYAKSLQK